MQLTTKHYATLGMLVGLILIILGEVKAVLETAAYSGPHLVTVGFFLFVLSVLGAHRSILLEALRLLFGKDAN